MGACCSTEEDKENINIGTKSGSNKKPADRKGGKIIQLFLSNASKFSWFSLKTKIVFQK
jgi:hypothetical protein